MTPDASAFGKRDIEAIDADLERAMNLARVRPEEYDVIEAMRTIRGIQE